MAGPTPLLSAREITKSFGGRRILDGAVLEIADGDRVGLLGPNGSGKSTLLRALAELDPPDGGELTRRRGLVVAHLPQIVDGDSRSAVETVLAARPELASVEEELHAVERRLAAPETAADLRAMERALAHQERVLERWTAIGGGSADGDARATLRSLGLDDDDLDRPTTQLSGGQRKLVALSACLAQRPALLLLDEPEAHLDMGRRGQLERLVREFDGAVVMVSHDRYLLDECVEQIAELDRGKIRIWPGNYSAYTCARQLELERQAQVYTSQQKEIARLEEAVRRFKHWAHIRVNERAARQARVKQMQIDRMDKVERPVFERRKMGLELRSGVRGGQRVLALEGIDVGFGDDPVLLDVDLTVMRGERVGIVGPNGAGQDRAGERDRRLPRALVRVALDRAVDRGRLPVAGGRRDRRGRHGHRHAAQGAVDERGLGGAAADEVPVRLRAGAAAGALAVRRRADAAGVPAADAVGPNCLVLDEPTNHLDIDSIEVVEDALERFDGTVIAVSHDRYFLDRIADRIVLVADGGVASFEGGWTDNADRALAVAVRG